MFSAERIGIIITGIHCLFTSVKTAHITSSEMNI